MPMFPTPGQSKIGLFPKLAYTAFMVVFVPFYLYTYGPTNFVYFCDCSLVLGFIAIWTESALLASMPAVGIVVVQFLWVADFIAGFFGFRFGLADYMFDPQILYFTRSMSLFHGWLPFLLLWMVHRLGYDFRAILTWTPLAYTLLCISYFLLPAPPAPLSNPNLPVNVNLVFGMNSVAPQTWMTANHWFLLLAGSLTVIFVITHIVYVHVMPESTD